ncbi:AgmX/PglI C-terminal domain-containing protein [Psychromonas sp.]|uniref:AgmX/PglI C-terminal domain-containing protein n=1 Tax=Psychromonas sp. TaxID=1884585 RepID=UPI00356A020A
MSYIENKSLPRWNPQIENGFFNTLAIVMLAITLLFSVFVSFVELPELSREEKEKLPPQLVKIMKSKVEVKPPEPKPEQKKETAKPEVAKPKPEPIPKPKPNPNPKPQVTKKELEKKAKDKAEQSGLLALSQQLNAMRDVAKAVPTAVTSTDDGLAQGNGTAVKAQRIILGQKAAGTSGGVTGKRFTDVGQGTQLASNQSGQVAQVATVVDKMAQQVKETKTYESASGKRSSESIRQMFDRNKSAIYSIYRRALRSDPSLEGSVTVKLIILPDGRVSAVSIIASEIDNDDFAAKLLRRIRLINFTPKSVAATELEYTFNFLPF